MENRMLEHTERPGWILTQDRIIQRINCSHQHAVGYLEILKLL